MKNTWFILSLVGVVTISMMTVINTYLIRKGLSSVFVLFMMVVVIGIISGSQLLITHGLPKTIPPHFWVLLIVAGIFSAIGNLAIFRATAISPNPGLVVTILGLQGGLVAVLAVFFLKDKLNLVQFIGIVVGIVAIMIIGLGSRSNKRVETIQPGDKTSLAPTSEN